MSKEFFRLRAGVEKAVLLTSFSPSRNILPEVSRLMWTVSLEVNSKRREERETYFLLQIVLTTANSRRERKMKQVQERNQMSMNLT